MMGTAVMKIQQNVGHRPKLRVNECCPYVAIVEPLTAESVKLSRLWRRSERVGRIILICAPVSTRKLCLLM